MGFYYPKVREPLEIRGTRFGVDPGAVRRFADLSFDRLRREANRLPDVFISHQCQDLTPAHRVAAILQYAGVSTYVDADDPDVHGDSLTLEVHLRYIIRNSQALLAICTPNTSESWWVPFEIGAAREAGKVISSFVDKSGGVTLPSYLAAWPVITSEAKLKEWAADFIHSSASKRNVDEVLRDLRGKYRYG